jgi:hypothetical protein
VDHQELQQVVLSGRERQDTLPQTSFTAPQVKEQLVVL